MQARVRVDGPDVDLDRGLVRRSNQSVGPRALARDVEVDGLALVVLHPGFLVFSRLGEQLTRKPARGAAGEALAVRVGCLSHA